MDRARGDPWHLGASIALASGMAAVFLVPAWRATAGDWPAPLDDVFIHYDFARSAATGHPFEWIAGQGYSSGETAPLYAFVLAVGYLAGFRGMWLGAWATLVAVVSLVALMDAVRRLMRDLHPAAGLASRAAPFVAAGLFVAVGMLDWSWFSGMETALFGGVLARALLAAHHARKAGPLARPRAQWATGVWCAALVLVRPEAVIVAFALAVAVARRARSQSGWAATARVVIPAATVTAAMLGANRILLGDGRAAGAALKLLSSNPYLSDFDRAREVAHTLALAYWKVLQGSLSAVPGLWVIVPSLGGIALLTRPTRALTAACLASALGWSLLVSLNGAARFQNFRYFAPALALLLFAAALGLSALARRRLGAWVGGAVGIAAIALAAPRVGDQVAFFREASKNVHDQQVEVGRRLSRVMPPGASVLVGDAGAIPYVASRHAIDALGLGGYHRLPFVRAAVLGEAATVELLERLPPSERPSYLALYPNWFSGITRTFGHEIARVTLDHNVICGGPTKVIYGADWSPLAVADDERPGEDVLDTADVVSEEEHAYQSPAPFGGWTRMDVRTGDDGRAVFDAARVTPQGRSERFVARRDVEGPAALDVRTDGEAGEVDVTVGRAPTVPLGGPEQAHSQTWSKRRAYLPSGVRAGDTITLTVRRGELHDYHVWIGRTEARAGNDASTREGSGR